LKVLAELEMWHLKISALVAEVEAKDGREEPRGGRGGRRRLPARNDWETKGRREGRQDA